MAPSASHRESPRREYSEPGSSSSRRERQESSSAAHSRTFDGSTAYRDPVDTTSPRRAQRASHDPTSTTTAAPNNTNPSVSRTLSYVGNDIYAHPAAVAYANAHPRRAIPKFGPYLLLQTLGEGEFGKVKLGLHSQWGEEVAVKLIRRGTIDTVVRMSKVEREIEVLRTLKHPHIVRLYDVIETDKYIGIILEYASGGELFDHILAHRYLRERDAAKLFHQLISGVWYIHEKKIVHRDLKLENLLLDRNRNVIITDFGFANKFEHRADDLMQTSCGSPCYAAPELVISEGLYVGSAVDIWSCGVILYAMLAGYLPFDDDPANPDGDNINLLYKYIVNTPLSFPDYVSAEARDLLSIMLVPDPKSRANLDQVMRHPWLDAFWSQDKDAIESLGTAFGKTAEDLERIALEQHQMKRAAYQKQIRALAAARTTEPLKDRVNRNTINVASPPSGNARYADANRPGDRDVETVARHASATYTTPSSHRPTNGQYLYQTGKAGASGSNDDPFAADSTVPYDNTFATPPHGAPNLFSTPESQQSDHVQPDASSGSGSGGKNRSYRHTVQVEYDSAATNRRERRREPTPSRAEPQSRQDMDYVPVIIVDKGKEKEVVGKGKEIEQRIVSSSREYIPVVTADKGKQVDRSPSHRRASSDHRGNAPSTPPREEKKQAPVRVDYERHRHASSRALGTTSMPGTLSMPLERSPTQNKAVEKEKERQIQAGVPQPVLVAQQKSIPAPPEKAPAKDKAAEKKSRRNTLTVMIEPFRSFRSMRSKTAPVNGNSSAADIRSGKNESTATVNAPQSVLTPRGSGLSPSIGGGTGEGSVRTGDAPSLIHSPQEKTGSAADGAELNGASTKKARKVMDWFRSKSKAHDSFAVVSSGSKDRGGRSGRNATVGSVVEDAGRETNGRRVSLSMWRKNASSATVHNTNNPAAASTTAPPASAPTASTPAVFVTTPSQPATPVAPSVSGKPARTPSSATADLSFMGRLGIRSPAGFASPSSSYRGSSLRSHHGAVDVEMVTTGAPPEVMKAVREALGRMGLELYVESEYKYRCIRPKWRKVATLNGGSVALSPGAPGVGLAAVNLMGTAASNGVDKRGLPVPSPYTSSSFRDSSGGMLRGLLMRRQSSQMSSSAAAGNVSYDEEASNTSGLLAVDPGSDVLYGDIPTEDAGDEVRFSVELTRLDRLEGTYSLDIRRLKGNLRSYKFVYDTVRVRLGPAVKDLH